MIVQWIACLFSFLGCLEGARKQHFIRALRMNALYTIGSSLGIIYFIATAQWPFVLLYIGYTITTIKGVILNAKQQREITHRKITYL